ncbi:hypothetical protein PO909_008485 [Leuciscus waleckii]
MTDDETSYRTRCQLHCEKRELSVLPALFSLLPSLQPPTLTYISGEARHISNKPNETAMTLKEFEDNILTTKLRKYRRDANDYQTGKVYKWLFEEETQRDPLRGHRTQQFGFTSDSDFPSDSDSSRSAHRFQTRQFPKNDQWNKGRKSQKNGKKNKTGNQGRRGEDKRNGLEMGPVTRQQARVRS